MKTHIFYQVVENLDLNVNNSALFLELCFSLMLLSHQLTEDSMMLKIKQTAYHFHVNNKSAFQVLILANDMNLEKIIEVLFLIYFTYKKNLQIDSKCVSLSELILIYILFTVIIC